MDLNRVIILFKKKISTQMLNPKFFKKCKKSLRNLLKDFSDRKSIFFIHLFFRHLKNLKKGILLKAFEKNYALFFAVR